MRITFEDSELTLFDIGGGFGCGCLISAGLSYAINHSIVWAFLHGCCSWLYVSYQLFSMYVVK